MYNRLENVEAFGKGVDAYTSSPFVGIYGGTKLSYTSIPHDFKKVFAGFAVPSSGPPHRSDLLFELPLE